MAAACDELGAGTITSVDLASSKDLRPNLENLLEDTGLARYCEIHREQNSYTWFLKKEIERNTHDYICNPVYDFCFIDGPKNWTIDGLAFFLVDKLLRQDGWILFDDYRWVYSTYSKELLDGITIRELSSDQASTPNIEAVFQLLVMQHPSYSRFEIDEDWAWAQKVKASEKHVKMTATKSLKYRAMKRISSLISRLN